MISFPRLLALSLLGVSLNPFGSHAQPESSNPRPTSNQTGNSATSQPPTVPATRPSQMILSLNAAIAMAVQKNIDLRIEAHNSKMATIDAIKSYGVYNPTLNVSGTGGVTAVPGEAFFSTKTMTTTIGLTQYLPTGGNISATTQSGYFSFEPTTTTSKEWQSTAGIAFSQPLLRNAGKETFELNITLSATTLQDSLERFRSSTSDTVSNVINSYNRLYVLRQIQETRNSALISAQALMDGIKKKEPGSAQGLEIANADFAIAQRRKDFIEASRSVTDQETNLRYQIGLDSTIKIIPSDPPSKIEPMETDEMAVKAALEFRSDLKQLRNSLYSARLQERVAKHQSLPDLSINASGGLSGTGYNFGESYRQIGSHPGTYWTAGMQFSVPLGNTTASNEYIKSKIRTEQVQDQIKALSWRIRNDVEYNMRALISARLQMQLADKSSQSAEQRLEQYRKSNLLNTSTIQDVLNAENDLNIARNTQLEAVETFSNAVTKLWKDTGLLLDRHGIRISKSQPWNVTDSQVPGTSLIMEDIPPTTASQATTAATEQEPASEKPTAIALPSTTPSVDAGKVAATESATAQVAATVTGKSTADKTYTLTIGEYLSKSVMADAIAKMKSVGLEPQIKAGPQKLEQVIRLYFAEFPDQLQAQKALKKLQLKKVNGFIMINKKQKYAVYTGSYLDQNSAESEQSRLAKLGIKVRFEKTSNEVSTFQLSAENIRGLEMAQKYAKDLEQQGLKPVVSENP